MSGFSIRKKTDGDQAWIDAFISDHWGEEFIVVHAERFRPGELDGFVAFDLSGQVIGLITYVILQNQCEVMTLNSVREGIGVGTALLHAVQAVASGCGCQRIWLITTNDNLSALGFYQKRGYELVKINRHALEKSRKLKSSIPLIASNGIPIRDEIELELLLG
ncbi:GNAT family N-acetyltransferase [bacterium]|nr:GNAT family N-acetyltransferase [candidate division CSSED10-310 bacterium]